MTTVRNMILAAGLASAMAPAVLAQYAFPTQFAGPGDSGTMNASWQNISLGTAPAGTYSTYAIITDWFSTGGTYQWSSEADIALTTGAITGGTIAAPTGQTTIHRNANTAATGSLSTTASRTNMYWTGTLTNNWTSTGSNTLNMGYASDFASGVNNARLQNVRVILNPAVNIINDMALPTSFTELGTFTDTHGRTTNSVSQTAGSQLNWFHFAITSGVNAGVGGGLLDIDTEGSTGGITDTEMRLYRLDPATNRLVPAGAGAFGSGEDAHADDDGGGSAPSLTNGYLSQFSYGDINTGAWVNGAQRAYGTGANGNTGGFPSNYDGRDGSLVAGDYYLLVTDYNITETATVITPTTFNPVTGASSGQNSWSVASSGGGGTGTIMVNIAYVPTPGAAALLGCGILASARRRRV